MKYMFRIAMLAFAGAGFLYAQPTITSVVDPYTQSTQLAPGGQAVINGSGLGNNDPTRIITVNGKTAFVLSGSSGTGQVTFEIPVDAGTGSAPVVISNANGTSSPFPITLATYAPVLINSQSGSIISPRHSSGAAVTPSNPATDGETIMFSAIGLGPTNPAQVTGVAANGQPTTSVPSVNVGQTHVPSGVTAVAASGQVALYTITFPVPTGIVSNSYPVTISAGGVTSNSASLSVGTAAASGPTVTSVTDIMGGAKLCPGGQAIISGSGLGSSPNVTVGGKNAYLLVTPASSNGASMTIQIPVDAPLGANNLVVTLGSGAASAPFSLGLVQFAPLLPTTGTSANLAQAFHLATAAPVTASAPASPNEQIGVIAIGLGPTSPQVPTGATASTPPPNTTTQPTVTMGGQAATGVNASATPGQVATYLVTFNVPGSLSNGNASVTVGIGGATSNAVNIPVSTAPYITSVVNAASGIVAGLPNAGIAQGAIFLVVGGLLGPANLSIAPNPFQIPSLSGTSISVSVAGATVSPLMYYTSAGQLAALLPSNTPTGPGTITVTYNNQTGPRAPITVVQNNLGIFTVTSNGEGAGIVTYPDYSLVSASKAANCGGPNTTCGAANPGDTLILWATGLGPVSGSDASGAGLGVNQTNVPLTVWLGGVQAPVLYQGRSGCCIGEDQIVFTVPNGVATGCAVPLAIQINSEISNNVVISVANGSRACTATNPAFNSAAVAQLGSNTPTTYGQIALNRQDNYPGGLQDVAKLTFGRFTVAPAYQPFFVSYIDDPPVGTCLVSNSLNGGNPPFANETSIDAGAQLTINGPNGTQNLTSSNTTLSANGTYLSAGTYTVSNGSGGADVKGFTASLTIPALPVMTSPQPDVGNAFSVTRSSGLAVTWTGGATGSVISLTGQSATDNTGSTGAGFECSLASAAGTFTVPAYVLLALPAGSFGNLDFHPAAIPATYSAGGLNLGFISAQRDYFSYLTFK